MVETESKTKMRPMPRSRGTVEWSPDLAKLAPPGLDICAAPAFAEYPLAEELGDQRLEAAYIAMAGIVTTYGESYLPIFRRLHDERTSRLEARSLLTVARSLCEENPLGILK